MAQSKKRISSTDGDEKSAKKRPSRRELDEASKSAAELKEDAVEKERKAEKRQLNRFHRRLLPICGRLSRTLINIAGRSIMPKSSPVCRTTTARVQIIQETAAVSKKPPPPHQDRPPFKQQLEDGEVEDSDEDISIVNLVKSRTKGQKRAAKEEAKLSRGDRRSGKRRRSRSWNSSTSSL